MSRDRQGDIPSTGDLLEKIEGMKGEGQMLIGRITEVIGGRAHGLVLLILSLPGWPVWAWDRWADEIRRRAPGTPKDETQRSPRPGRNPELPAAEKG